MLLALATTIPKVKQQQTQKPARVEDYFTYVVVGTGESWTITSLINVERTSQQLVKKMNLKKD